MRALVLLPLLVVSCADPSPVAGLVALDLASVMVFGRGVTDIGVSAVSGRDCSIVRLDRGQTYCTPVAVREADAYCTPTLGRVDCWTSPALLPRPTQGVADTPPASAGQERYRAARWPKALMAE